VRVGFGELLDTALSLLTKRGLRPKLLGRFGRRQARKFHTAEP
jgi:hypothetical protein